MTVNYRTSLTSSNRFGYPIIAKQAMLKMGVVSLYDTLDDDITNMVYDTILDITLETINSNMLGEFKTRVAKSETYKAKPFDHVIKDDSDGPSTISLPFEFHDAMGVKQYTKSLDCIKITDTCNCSVMYFMFDDTIKKWCNINEPIFNVDSIPLSTFDRSGYIDYLILRLAPYFGISDTSILGPSEEGAERWKSGLMSRNIGSRDGERSYLFGSIGDEYYLDRYTIRPLFDYSYGGLDYA